MLSCDKCKQGNKGNYKSIWIEKNVETWCYDCLGLSPSGKTDKQMFEHISTPYWQHLGLKPNAKEKAKLKYLKDHNMTWGDERRMREAGLEKKNLAYEALMKHQEKYGNRSAPDVEIKKENR